MILSALTLLCSHPPPPSPAELLHLPRLKLRAPAPGTTVLLSASKFAYSGHLIKVESYNIRSSCVWLISCSVTFSRLVHIEIYQNLIPF